MNHIKVFPTMITNSKPRELWSNALYRCQKELEAEYKAYRSGKINEKEFLRRIRPIDMVIGKLEMATLHDIPHLRDIL